MIPLPRQKGRGRIGGAEMTLDALILAFVLVTTSGLTAAAVLFLGSALSSNGARQASARLGPVSRVDPVFLIDGAQVLDANDRGEDMMRLLADASGQGAGPDWGLVARHLVTAFPDLGAHLAQIEPAVRRRLEAADGSGRALLLEGVLGHVRVTLTDTSADDGTLVIDRLSFRALEDEVETLRNVTDRAPVLAWRENDNAQVIWANGAYLRFLVDNDVPGAGQWPLPAIFANTGTTGRHEVTHQNAPAWFDLHRLPDAMGTLCFALPADEAQRAERARRNFVQMLTKTFATLPIGLAVFDRSRRLQVFNPALGDLTGLETEFLLSRPGLEGFLNRMREKRSLPEPRDFHGWSRRLLQIETGEGARDLEELWTLPGGETYRVSLRPHPDGGLSLVIEDVTAETHLSRNFRAELDTSQGVLDMLDQALVVFGADGQTILTNRAFDQLWHLREETSLAGVHFSEALAQWRDETGDASIWDSIASVARRDGPAAMAGRITRQNGCALRIQARRASNGTLMVTFDSADTPPRVVPSPAQGQSQGMFGARLGIA